MTTEEHFNGLTPAEAELLALLAEECGEVVQAVTKILRHGLDYESPASFEPNRVALEKEMGDLRAAMLLLCSACITSKDQIHRRASEKLRRVEQWLHHAKVPEELRR